MDVRMVGLDWIRCARGASKRRICGPAPQHSPTTNGPPRLSSHTDTSPKSPLPHPSLHRSKDPSLPLGQASISAHLRAHNVPHSARSFSVHDPAAFSLDAVLSHCLSGSSPRTLLAFGAFVWAEKELTQVLRGLRREGFQGTIAVGGPQVREFERGDGRDTPARPSLAIYPHVFPTRRLPHVMCKGICIIMYLSKISL
jgi:hypothetical protein